MNFTDEYLGKLTLREQTLEELDEKYYPTLRADFPVTEIRSLDSIKRYINQGMYFCYELYLKEDDDNINNNTEEEEEENSKTEKVSKIRKWLSKKKIVDDVTTPQKTHEKYVGYAYFLKDPLSGWMLLDYLGVKEELRGKGYGSMFLTKVLKELGRDNYVFIEVESPEFLPFTTFDAHRQKRFDFYIKNGLIDSGVVTETYTVFYTILVFKEGVSADGIPSKREIGDLYLRLYKYILGYRICKENVRVAYPEISVDSLDDIK